MFFLQSSMSISAVPEITSSSSRASKRLTKLASNTFGKKMTACHDSSGKKGNQTCDNHGVYDLKYK